MPSPYREEIEFGDTETVSDSYALTKAEKDGIARNIPEKITIDFFLGSTDIAVRKPLRDLLDNLPSPTFDADFTVEGDCENLDTTVIECTAEEMTGTHTGQLQVAGVGATFSYRARVVARRYSTKSCKCPDGTNGRRRERLFEIRWFLDVDINPGVGGSYKLDTRTATISTPCCCRRKEEEKPKEQEIPVSKKGVPGKPKKEQQALRSGKEK